MAGKTLTVRRADPRTLEWHELASFTLGRDGKVKATFKDRRFEGTLRRDGVRFGGKTLRPDDGVDFMRALEKAYSTSALMDVRRS